ncbi:flagellar motor protein MotB [Aquimonas voraii]|uniref:Chemotaxis protein MotB n=1 Tax=Aquimonas voraii TaxID=265719 RepID=A0A1G6T6T4_9GAMM|nr:flagellar motor protein MotB [Aquimonas voraii]SDD24741.1 chemotaxis protein MotB [Aquimonas voraii]
MADAQQPIIIKRVKKVAGGHHGGAWKVAYADFVTAMMAFFLVMWLVVSLPEEKLSGISEYFKNPSVLRGTSQAPPPAAMGAGGSGTNPVRVGPSNISPTMDGEGPKIGEVEEVPDAEEAKRLAEEQEKRELQSLKEELEAAIEKSQALQPFKDQLLLDITPEGLRIQIVDEQNRPMFDSGSATLKDYTREILKELTPYIDSVDKRISLSGHTDTTPYASRNGYSNWELSADRANAARRELVRAGLPEDKVSRVVGLSSSVLFDKDQPTNPINRRISIIIMNRAAEDAARRTDGFGAESAAGEDLPPALDAGNAGGDASGDAPAEGVALPARPDLGAAARALQEQGIETRPRN